MARSAATRHGEDESEREERERETKKNEEENGNEGSRVNRGGDTITMHLGVCEERRDSSLCARARGRHRSRERREPVRRGLDRWAHSFLPHRDTEVSLFTGDCVSLWVARVNVLCTERSRVASRMIREPEK